MVVISDCNTQRTLILSYQNHDNYSLFYICTATLSNYLELNDFLHIFLHYIVQFTLLSRQKKTETRRSSTSLLTHDLRFSRLETWIISLCSHLFVFLVHNGNNFIKNSDVQNVSSGSRLDRVHPFPEIFWMQDHSHQYSWLGFNRTSFRGNSLKFSGTSCRPVGSHVVIVDGVEINGCK